MLHLAFLQRIFGLSDPSATFRHLLYGALSMRDKNSGVDWVLALIAFLWHKEHQEHKEALERQRAEIKPFWWENNK